MPRQEAWRATEKLHLIVGRALEERIRSRLPPSPEGRVFSSNLHLVERSSLAPVKMASAPHTPDPETNHSQQSTEIDWLSDTDLSALINLDTYYSEWNPETPQQSIEEPNLEIECMAEETQETSPETRNASPRISDEIASMPLSSAVSQPSGPLVQPSPGTGSGSEGKSKPLAELEQETEVRLGN